MNSPQTPLSPARVWAMGLVFVAFGVAMIAIGLNAIAPAQPDPDAAPLWVGMCASLMFVACGFAVIFNFGIAGGAGADGYLPAGTPMWIRFGSLVSGLAVVGFMGAVFGWIAFGAGGNKFAAIIPVPFGEAIGRTIFGAFTLVVGLMFVQSSVAGVKRLLQTPKHDWDTP